jgi:hypothetical protein
MIECRNFLERRAKLEARVTSLRQQLANVRE